MTPRHPVRTRRLRPRAFAGAIEALEQRALFSVAFASSADHELTGFPEFVAAADFNEDGHMDLVASSYNDSSLNVLIGIGDGTFNAATPIDLSSAPDHVVVGDVNTDGHADLVAVSYDAQTVSVLFGNGNGTFQSATSYAAGAGARAAVLGDFNCDGKLDIAIAKSFQKSLTILLNNGNGTFGAASSTTISITPTDLAVGDFNGDNKPDLAAADYFGNVVGVMLGNGNGTFQAATTYATGSGPAAIATGDLNGDTCPDIATANYGAGTVSVLRSNGNGTFQAATNLTTGASSTFVAISDFDMDGKRDIAAVSMGSISVLLGNGNCTFQPVVQYARSEQGRSLVAADFDASGLPDLAVANEMNNTISVFLGFDTAAPAPVAMTGGPFSVAEGATTQLDASGSTGSALVYTWDLDSDGVFGETGTGATRGVETGSAPTFLASGLDGPGTYVVSLMVTDGLDRSNTTTATITITNTAPVLTIGGENSAPAESTYTLGLSGTDAGPETISGWVIDWGDGNTQSVSGNPSTVTHQFASPGSITISATATDEDGTYSSNTQSLTVTTPDTTAPSASLQSASNVLTEGGSTYSFVVSYSDNIAVEPTSLDSNDILVAGPGGFSQLAHFVSSSGNSTNRMVTYSITVPGGSWDLVDNGTYSISLRSNQVTDSSNNPAAAGTLGSFVVVAAGPDIAGNDLATANDVGGIAPGLVRARVDAVTALDRNDFYKFTVVVHSKISVKLYLLNDNAALMLLDSGGNQLFYSNRSGNNHEAFAKLLSPGVYYFRVIYKGDVGTTYRLRYEATEASVPVGNLSGATPLGTLLPGSARVADGVVNTATTARYYSFRLTSSMSIYAKLYNLTDDADLAIIDSAGHVLQTSNNTDLGMEGITLNLSPGTYFAQVTLAGPSSAGYRLRLAQA